MKKNNPIPTSGGVRTLAASAARWGEVLRSAAPFLNRTDQRTITIEIHSNGEPIQYVGPNGYCNEQGEVLDVKCAHAFNVPYKGCAHFQAEASKSDPGKPWMSFLDATVRLSDNEDRARVVRRRSSSPRRRPRTISTPRSARRHRRPKQREPEEFNPGVQITRRPFVTSNLTPEYSAVLRLNGETIGSVRDHWKQHGQDPDMVVTPGMIERSAERLR